MPSKGSTHLQLLVCGGPVLAMLLAFLTGAAGSLQYIDASPQRKAHYCGAKLSDTLAELCNRFNGFRKKSENPLGSFHEARLLDDVQHDVERLRVLHGRSSDMIYKALMTLQHLNGHDQGMRRVRRQVVAECCYQSCTLETLKSYCAD